MRITTCLPDDPGECQRLLEDLLRRNEELRQQAQTAQHVLKHRLDESLRKAARKKEARQRRRAKTAEKV